MKKNLLWLLLLITATTLIFADIMEPAKLLVPLADNTQPAVMPRTRNDVPEFTFHINPMSIMTTYYDYFPGSYDSVPIRVQPSPAGMYDGGGIYMVFQATPEAGGVRKVYYAYISNGVVTSQGLVNPTAPANRAEGFPNMDMDMDTGNPVYTWHSGTDATPGTLDGWFTFDQYDAIGFPGLLNQAYPVIRNPYTIDGEDGNEFVWPSIFVGPAPTEGMKRIYIVGKNFTRNIFDHPSENALIVFADYESIVDLSVYDADQWSVVTVPQLNNWRATDVRTFRSTIVSKETGHIAIVGHSSDLASEEPFGENDVMFVLENTNYGEGAWDFFTVDPTIPVTNPVDPTTGVGYFTGEGEEPFQDMRYGPYVNRHNVAVDDEGNYHFVSMYSLSTEGNSWYPQLTSTKHVKYNRQTQEFTVNDLYPRKEGDARYIPWDDPPFFFENGNLRATQSWPCYWWETDDVFHENYHRVIADGPYMVALVQESLKSRFYHQFNAEGYASFASAPQTLIFLSNDYGESWSEPITMNANFMDAEADEEGYFHGHYVPQLMGLIPTYWYIADDIEMINENWGRIHLMFLSQNDYGSSIQGNSAITGGSIMYASMDLKFNPGEDDTTYVEKDTERLPATAYLNSNYPNPFNPTTTISYSVPVTSNIKLEVYNVKGQLIKTLVDGQVEAGERFAVWNGTDNNGTEVGSGVYFYKLTTDTVSEMKKMLLVK